jgi:hypothetical protein
VMNRCRVTPRCGNVVKVEVLHQSIALLYMDHVKMIHMFAARPGNRCLDWQIRQTSLVDGSE